MSIVLCILILVMGVIVHKIYASCVTVIHFGFSECFLRSGSGVLWRELLL